VKYTVFVTFNTTTGPDIREFTVDADGLVLSQAGDYVFIKGDVPVAQFARPHIVGAIAPEGPSPIIEASVIR